MTSTSPTTLSTRIVPTLVRPSYRARHVLERTVGDGDHYALVDIPYMNDDLEYVRCTKETLEDAFKVIFDNRRVRVMTDAEWLKETSEPLPSEG